jgi:hypothetical protein
MGASSDLDLADLGARIQSLSVRLAAIGDARELEQPVEEVSNAGYGVALVLDAESRRTRRGILARPTADEIELVRTLDALEVASRELRLSLARLRARVDWVPPASSPGA